MKRLIYVIAIVMISSFGFGQKADFTGAWKLKEKEADPGHGNSLAPNTLVLEQTSNTLSLKKNFTWDGQDINNSEKYTLDGMVCKNPPDADKAKTSIVSWEQNNTRLKISSKIPLVNEGQEATTIEVFWMDGDKLVIESSATSPDGELIERFILERQ